MYPPLIVLKHIDFVQTYFPFLDHFVHAWPMEVIVFAFWSVSFIELYRRGFARSSVHILRFFCRAKQCKYLIIRASNAGSLGSVLARLKSHCLYLWARILKMGSIHKLYTLKFAKVLILKRQEM